MPPPAKTDPIDELLALQGAEPLPGVHDRALAALREAIGADAVLAITSGPPPRMAGASSPSAEIAANLAKTAIPVLESARRDRATVKKFTFREKAVHMVAAVCGTSDLWLVAWTRAEGDALRDQGRMVRLAAACFPASGEGTLAAGRAALALITSFGKPRAERLSAFCAEVLVLLGAKSVVAGRHGLKGWLTEASCPAPPPAPRSALGEAIGMALSAHGRRETATTGEGGAALEEIARLSGAGSADVIPCGSGWALVVTWDAEAPPPRALEESVRPLVPLLPSLHRHSRGAVENWRSASPRRRGVWVAASVALVLLMVFPFRARIHAPVVVEPSLRRFVAAPFDGVLKKVHVNAGDIVTEGTLLAELDGREVRERIAEIEAQAAAATLQSASDLASSRLGESALSALQARRAGHELEVLRERERNLQILAPVAGVVTQGDLEREEGSALQLGRTILEIAPLGTMIVEAAVREDDVALVKDGQAVTIRLHSLPGKSLHATVNRLSPRAETRDGRNVFIAEAQVDNADGQLRPGMKGEAVILGERMPLFWILFRKPWNALRGFFFW